MSGLKPNPRNARTHPASQIAKLKASIAKFGFTNPVLVDETGMVLAGHGRLEAAQELGLAEIPTICISNLTPAEKRAYMLADNRIAQQAGWDDIILADELTYLSGDDIGFSVEVTGFDTAAIDLLLDHGKRPCPDPEADNIVEPSTSSPVSRLGDIWQLGGHRLICGDVRDPRVCEQLLDGDLAQMLFADPPYNVLIDGHARGLGRVRHGNFAMASGEMSPLAFTGFLERSFGNCAMVSAKGSIHFICMDWRHMPELHAAGLRVYGAPKNLIVWNKTNGGMGSFYRSQHELIYVFRYGNAPHINNFGLGETGRYRTNVWVYQGVNTFRKGRNEELNIHPTVKPVALVADAIRDCSRRRGIILDPFSGSGTAIIAAEKTGRRGYAIEIDPTYVDAAIRRFELFTGVEATLVGTGETFATVERQRIGKQH
ncbi:MAG: DNA methyltransferase [Micropepsaceae bacterium]